jgi:hypothetical protein
LRELIQTFACELAQFVSSIGFAELTENSYVELKEVVRIPDGHAPVSADRRPLPEDNADGAAPTYLDLRPFRDFEIE